MGHLTLSSAAANFGTTHNPITQNHTIMKNDTKIDANGGSYYVISGFGWAQDANPFRAFMKLAESANVTGQYPKAKDRKANGSLTEAADDGIMVYYVADDSKCKGFNFYCPADADNKPIGVLVYGGDNNAQLVASLENAITRTW